MAFKRSRVGNGVPQNASGCYCKESIMHFIYRLCVYVNISAGVKILIFVSRLIFLHAGLFQSWKNSNNIFYSCAEKDSWLQTRGLPPVLQKDEYVKTKWT